MSLSSRSRKHTLSRQKISNAALMPNMASPAKTRRLRASCDGCFAAKVKCSKERPMCDRCLSCGSNCTYSPSSRAGKPKPDGGSNVHPSTTQDVTGHPQVPAQNILGYPGHHHQHRWDMPTTSADSGIGGSYSVPEFVLGGVDGENIAWFPTDDLHTMTGQPAPGHIHAHPQYNPNMAIPWPSTHGQELLPFGQPPPPAQMPEDMPLYLNFPSAGPSMPLPLGNSSSPTEPNGSGAPCRCLADCMASLYTLETHTAPGSLAFHEVLSLNHKAVRICGTMLLCSRCPPQGVQTRIKVLATIIGKIASLYKEASTTQFGNAAFGSTPDFHMFQEVCDRFRALCTRDFEDSDFGQAMITYVERSFHSSMTALRQGS
ncbi:hypothetical protein QBC33DRAFT_526352 [Phialemonium atrogriseum]|uniref:Zn(2)-C6 fungal-type domain-containing protein n=1 Tax=Phialemonium atrogriseum TaxID=1093897 RepID=A0AAJ0C6P8_9PEZI|nr:uncharacterized protein QBC33DRAFT_526352 [Phialemonium atrogriseum]KAK1770971.1 hypothetical protein QBC33DRAFT_526352 [Phialemonium atrogriseum]